MRNSIGQYTNDITGTWTWKHKHVLITLSLLTALVWQGLGLAQYMPKAEAITYVSPVETGCKTLECIIEARALVIFEENQWLYMEMARTDAMEQTGHDVIKMMMVVK